MALLIVEIDGTLADLSARQERYLERDPKDWEGFHSDRAIATDVPYVNEIAFVLSFWANGENDIQIWTGRPKSSEDATREWLKKHADIADIRMRMRPTDSREKIRTLKETWLKKLPSTENVFVLDNRKDCVSLWRTYNILCLSSRKLEY